MREIVLDTETTGLDPINGDRITEVGCVELIDKKITGNEFQRYVNPQRDVPEIATQISGLTQDFLSAYDPFPSIIDDFLDFIGTESILVIHNAQFDLGFLNNELKMAGREGINQERVIDTLLIARQKFVGSPASLDALSRRFKIDIKREKHGALLDSQILAHVYIEMCGEKKKTLSFEEKQNNSVELDDTNEESVVNFKRRYFPASEQELENFNEMVKKNKLNMWDKVS